MSDRIPLTPEQQAELKRKIEETIGLETRRPALHARMDEELAKAKKRILEEIAEKSFGIRPEHTDGIYMQHPAMAGVIRAALRETFERAVSEVAKQLLLAQLTP